MSRTLNLLPFIVPLSFEAHAAAQRQLPKTQPQTQPIYLRALAVYAVDFYLRCLGIAASSDHSDWRDPWLSKFNQVADLWVEPWGKIECCPVLPDASHLNISGDAWADRIGYVAVQFESTLKSAILIGFTPTPITDLPLSQLQPIDQFPAYLESIAAVAVVPAPAPIPLRTWLSGAMTTGWQTLEELLGQPTVGLAVRSRPHEITVRQAKLIDVGMTLGEQSVILSLAITLNSDTSMNVLTQVYPAPQAHHLPPNLKLTMLSETKVVLQEVCSREQDNYIQLHHFRGEAGDSFEIQVSLNQVSICESFIL